MILIHLAKMTLLDTSSDYFGEVFVPEQVKKEVLNPIYPDAKIIEASFASGKIKVRAVKNKKLIERANEFNIQRGEAEAVALYWEMNADLIATDDDNVRKKRDVLRLNIIGTPAIILRLFKEKKINRPKLEESIRKLREIGWFSNTIWDKIRLEADKFGEVK